MVAALLLTFALFFRVGLLALFAMSVTGVLIRVPVTLDPNAWYFGHSLVVLLILAAYGGLRLPGITGRSSSAWWQGGVRVTPEHER